MRAFRYTCILYYVLTSDTFFTKFWCNMGVSQVVELHELVKLNTWVQKRTKPSICIWMLSLLQFNYLMLLIYMHSLIEFELSYMSYFNSMPTHVVDTCPLFKICNNVVWNFLLTKRWLFWSTTSSPIFFSNINFGDEYSGWKSNHYASVTTIYFPNFRKSTFQLQKLW